MRKASGFPGLFVFRGKTSCRAGASAYFYCGEISMHTNSKDHRCPECGAGMVWEVRETAEKYQGHERRHSVLAWWCTDRACGEGILQGESLAACHAVYLALRAEVDGQGEG